METQGLQTQPTVSQCGRLAAQMKDIKPSGWHQQQQMVIGRVSESRQGEMEHTGIHLQIGINYCRQFEQL